MKKIGVTTHSTSQNSIQYAGFNLHSHQLDEKNKIYCLNSQCSTAIKPLCSKKQSNFQRF